jgi:pyruvate/2-oxoglutarate dehydrogenase complex dihydrolipoamide acyltransferase (E2) component
MLIKVILPRLGLTMEEGTLLKWFKNVGESIEKDEPLFEIETDKVTMEVKSIVDGKLVEILVKEGETVPVLETVAMVEDTTGHSESKERS